MIPIQMPVHTPGRGRCLFASAPSLDLKQRTEYVLGGNISSMHFHDFIILQSKILCYIICTQHVNHSAYYQYPK